ncbi:hypothetical protein Pfo_025291, partial [Paulownia fortunei]
MACKTLHEHYCLNANAPFDPNYLVEVRHEEFTILTVTALGAAPRQYLLEEVLQELKVAKQNLLSNRRRVTLSEFRRKILVSIREYCKRDGKERPSAKAWQLSSGCPLRRMYLHQRRPSRKWNLS